jgi:hypothetical protein
MATKIPAPKDKLAGCIWLARIVAKARLLEKGELPPGYAERFGHPGGVDGQFLGFFKLSREDVQALARLPDEAAAEKFCSRPEGTPENIEKWNEIAVNMGRPGYPMSERFQVAKETAYKHVYVNGMTTVFELLEADDKLG